MACPHFMYKFFIIKVIRDIEKICSVESQNEEYAIMHSMNVFLYLSSHAQYTQNAIVGG